MKALLATTDIDMVLKSLVIARTSAGIHNPNSDKDDTIPPLLLLLLLLNGYANGSLLYLLLNCFNERRYFDN